MCVYAPNIARGCATVNNFILKFQNSFAANHFSTRAIFAHLHGQLPVVHKVLLQALC
jgi:hypothetical protein